MADSPQERSTVSIADWWKFTATGLLGVVITVAIGFASGWSHLITRADAKQMMDTESPYVQDRLVIANRLDVTHHTVDRLATKMDAMLEGQTKLSEQIVRLTEQVRHLDKKQAVIFPAK